MSLASPLSLPLMGVVTTTDKNAPDFSLLLQCFFFSLKWHTRDRVEGEAKTTLPTFVPNWEKLPLPFRSSQKKSLLLLHFLYQDPPIYLQKCTSLDSRPTKCIHSNFLKVASSLSETTCWGARTTTEAIQTMSQMKSFALKVASLLRNKTHFVVAKWQKLLLLYTLSWIWKRQLAVEQRDNEISCLN